MAWSRARAVRAQARRRRHLGRMAVAAAALAYAAPISDLGWNQGSHYALVEALDRGTPRIDRWRWQTGDVSYVGGHFYSVKAPGLAAASVPFYALLEASGGEHAIEQRTPTSWKAARISIWLLGLWTVVLPAALLLLLVRSVAERVEPGLGTITALTLGLGTLVLPFSTVFFSHVLSAFLGFAAFALLFRSRGRDARLAPVAAAGLLAGLAVTTEYALAIVVLALGLYAVVAQASWAKRAIVYTAAAGFGTAPLLLYNRWAFGSIRHLSYAEAVSKRGRSGHAVLGANSKGFFGVGMPSPRAALEILLAPRGLLILSPVLALSAVGIVALYRQRRRAEALTISAIGLGFLTFNAGYYVAFPGSTTGPRLLVAALPFLAVPLAASYRRLPGCTVALATASAVLMLAATATWPLIGTDDTGRWADQILGGDLRDTTLTLFAGAGHGWLALLPFAVPVAIAVVLSTLATTLPAIGAREARRGAAAVLAWLAVAVVVPRAWHTPDRAAIALDACAGGLAVVALLATTLASARARRVARRSDCTCETGARAPLGTAAALRPCASGRTRGRRG